MQRSERKMTNYKLTDEDIIELKHLLRQRDYSQTKDYLDDLEEIKQDNYKNFFEEIKIIMQTENKDHVTKIQEIESLILKYGEEK